MPARTRFLAISFASAFIPIKRILAVRSLLLDQDEWVQGVNISRTSPVLLRPIGGSGGRTAQSHLPAKLLVARIDFPRWNVPALILDASNGLIPSETSSLAAVFVTMVGTPVVVKAEPLSAPAESMLDTRTSEWKR